MRETSCSAQRQLGSPPTTSLAGWIAAGRHARTLDLDHGGGARRQAMAQGSALHAASHGRVCALSGQWGATPRCTSTTGQMIPRPGPGNPRLLRRPNRIGLGRPCPLHWLALPSWNVRSLVRPPRPAGGGGPVDPARPSVDRAAAGGISCACECDPGRPRPAADLGPVCFSFFLTSFSENLAVVRIWLCRESEYY
jgi:hypothetical protein